MEHNCTWETKQDQSIDQNIFNDKSVTFGAKIEHINTNTPTSSTYTVNKLESTSTNNTKTVSDSEPELDQPTIIINNNDTNGIRTIHDKNIDEQAREFDTTTEEPL